MANLTENDIWEDFIYQIEKTDRVIGGPGGISNIQAGQLANRTQYLKKLLSNVIGDSGNLITADGSLLKNGWWMDKATGFIIQWGSYTTSSATFIDVSFSIPFPTAVLSMSNTVIRNSRVAGEHNWSAVGNVTLTGFSSGSDEHGTYWIALGV